MSLKISKDLSLPPDAITQTFSILAQRRVGKTYTASVMAEEFVANSLPFVALDPTGAWWGLRSSADGKSEGLPVVIIGGDHGDVPLEPTAGKVIADLVVDHPGYYVIDLSATESNAAQDRFATDFAERLYRRKSKVRTPLHLFVDEADCFAPQKPLPGQLTMLGAFETLVRRGGIRGIGTTLITQRAAVLNKNVLTQTDSLFVLRMNAPQDQDAIDEWVKRHGTKEQKDKMMESLAALPQGESWFWSPGWLGSFEKIRIRQRRTFNSSATPKSGEKILIPQKLATVDLEKLGKEISATIERASENDPQALKRKLADASFKITSKDKEIAELTARLEQAEKATKVETKTETVEVPVLTPGQQQRLDEAVLWVQHLVGSFEDAKRLAEVMGSLKTEVLEKLTGFMKPAAAPTKPVTMAPRHIPPPAPKIQPKITVPTPEGEVTLGRCEKAILAALMQYPQGRTTDQIAVLTGYRPTSGGYGGALTKLRALEYITRTIPTQITEAGRAAIGDNWEPLPTGKALAEYWIRKLPKCESQLLAHLVSIYPNGLGTQELAEATNYSPNSGGYGGALTKLRSMELISRGQPMKAADHLFQ